MNSFRNAAGAFSMPSSAVSRHFTLPSAIHFDMSAMKAGAMSLWAAWTKPSRRSSEHMMQKAAAMAVDHAFLDLEDAVAPRGEGARAWVIDASNRLDWERKTRCVRVNDATSPWALDDMAAVMTGCGDNLDTNLLPQIRLAADMLSSICWSAIGSKKFLGPRPSASKY